MVITTQAPENSDIDAIRNPVDNDMQAVDTLIVKALDSPIPLIQTIVKHIVKAGGKRLRPLCVVLIARTLEASGETPQKTSSFETSKAIHLSHQLATIVEFMHTATLLHDDVVDNSQLRRGHKTANMLWGNEASILIGDFLYSRAFELLASQNRPDILSVFAGATHIIVEGEVLQLVHRHSASLSREQYFDVIDRKTARLFATAAEIGARAMTKNTEHITAAAAYGKHLGLLFQIVDDILDYTANAQELGKTKGDDAREGKITLPVILALEKATQKESTEIQKILKNGGSNAAKDLIPLLDRYDAFSHAYQYAEQHAKHARAALMSLPENRYRGALDQLITFAYYRPY